MPRSDSRNLAKQFPDPQQRQPTATEEALIAVESHQNGMIAVGETDAWLNFAPFPKFQSSDIYCMNLGCIYTVIELMVDSALEKFGQSGLECVSVHFFWNVTKDSKHISGEFILCFVKCTIQLLYNEGATDVCNLIFYQVGIQELRLAMESIQFISIYLNLLHYGDARFTIYISLYMYI